MSELCEVRQDFDDRGYKCSGEVGAGSAPQDHLESAISNLFCGLFHEAGNVQVATLA